MIGEIDVGIFCDIHLCLETVSKEYPDGNILSFSQSWLAYHFKKNKFKWIWFVNTQVHFSLEILNIWYNV